MNGQVLNGGTRPLNVKYAEDQYKKKELGRLQQQLSQRNSNSPVAPSLSRASSSASTVSTAASTRNVRWHVASSIPKQQQQQPVPYSGIGTQQLILQQLQQHQQQYIQIPQIIPMSLSPPPPSTHYNNQQHHSPYHHTPSPQPVYGTCK